MARFVRCLRRTVFSKIGLPSNQNPNFLTSRRCLSSGSYVSEMQKSAFQGNICRLIRNEIEYELDHSPPLQPPSSFGPFTVDKRPGEQWISLKRIFGEKEDIKIEATMFDRSVPTSKSTSTEPEFVLHITFIVNISKGGAGAGAGETLEIMCSAWPDTIEISKLCIRKGIQSSPSSYGGPEFEYVDLILSVNTKKLEISDHYEKGDVFVFAFGDYRELDDELQDVLYQFLEERGISDELAVFLHRFMKNKNKDEYVRWMESVKSYVEQK